MKGAACGGIEGGNGRSLDGAGRTLRGASRKGSTCFLYVVNTSGRSRGSLKGMSRLGSY